MLNTNLLTMQPEYFEQLLDSRFENVRDQHEHINEKLNAILAQTTKTNGRVSDLEREIVHIKEWRATSQGHWNGVNKVLFIIGSLLGVILTAIATYLWH